MKYLKFRVSALFVLMAVCSVPVLSVAAAHQTKTNPQKTKPKKAKSSSSNVNQKIQNSPGAKQAGRDINIKIYRNTSARSRGYLLPANEPSPPNPCGEIPPNSKTIFFGNSAAHTADGAFAIFMIGEKSLLDFRVTPNGLFINALILNAKNREVAKITDNAFTALNSSGYAVDHSDSHTLVILDPQNKPVLQVRYLNSSAIKVLGTFYFPRVGQISIQEDEQVIGGVTHNGSCFFGFKRAALRIN